MKRYFSKYPWIIYTIIGIIVTLLCARGGYLIWYNYLDVTYIPGKVKGFSWQMDVYKYRLVTEEKGDWADELESGNYDVNCHPEWRTIEEEQSDGSIKKYDVIDQYCYYKVDSWNYDSTIPNSGTDKNPFYAPYPANSTRVKYEKQPGIFTVYFTSDITGAIHFNYDRATWDAFREGMTVQIGISRKGTVPYAPKLPQ